MRWLALLVLSIALVAAGCGGGSNESAATTTTETTTTESTSTEDTSTGTTDLSGILNDKDCLALAGIGATIAQALSGATSGNANTEELQQLVDKVPDEIQADVQTLADAFGQYAAKLKDIGIKAGSTPSAAQLQQLQAAIASLDQQKLTAASNHIEAWAKDNCSG
jgi:ABC-type glycerol-3-phosphate transport system substrate-binding protein